MAVFDVIVNNADRKGAHIPTVPSSHPATAWSTGSTFHVDDKQRTLLWG